MILAMLLAAIASAVVASVFADQQRWSSTVQHRRDRLQARSLAMAGVQWARRILLDDARSTVTDHLGEIWALPLPPVPLEHGEIRGAIVDAQSRLNVNVLAATGSARATEKARVERLFAQRGVNTAALPAISDWLDGDRESRAQGAEDSYYQSQPVAALAANAPAVRLGELAHVRGLTLPALRAVMPWLAALPEGTALNVNTAPPEVLLAALDTATPDDVAALVASRAQKPFTTIAEFRARLPQGTVLRSEEGLDVQSRYFLVTVEARQGESVARVRALVHRPQGPTIPAVVWELVE